MRAEMDRFMQAHVPLLVLADSDLVVVSCMFRLLTVLVQHENRLR